MKKVTIQYDDKIQEFDNVTKIQYFGAGDFFELYFVIYQGRKKTKIKLCKIIYFEVCEIGKENTCKYCRFCDGGRCTKKGKTSAPYYGSCVTNDDSCECFEDL